MTSTEPAAVPAGDTAGAPDQATEQQPPADSTDWKAEARKWEGRAKTSAASVAKAEARAADAETANAKLTLENLRLTVALEAGITGKHAKLVQGSDEDSLRESAAMVVELMNRPEQGSTMHVPAEGRTPEVALNSDALTDALRRAVGVR
jgi:hypothetical protein